MKTSSHRLIMLAAASVTLAAGLLWNGETTVTGGLISSAEARIGRPLTPMSYAGVARRTTRRAVGGGGRGRSRCRRLLRIGLRPGRRCLRPARHALLKADAVREASDRAIRRLSARPWHLDAKRPFGGRHHGGARS